MSNMSYCRFRNTLRDLEDCQDALEAMFDADCAPLSEEELTAAKRLVSKCQDILQLVADQGAIDLESEDGINELERDYRKIIDEANAACDEDEEE
jgi:hypothetical protein